MKGVVASVLAGLVCASALRAGVNEDLKSLEQRLDAAPQVASTSLCVQERATYGIVHFRQNHYVPPTPFVFGLKEGTKEERAALFPYMVERYSRINAIQKEIYDVIKGLRLTDLVVEGLTREHELDGQESLVRWMQLGILSRLGLFTQADREYIGARLMESGAERAGHPGTFVITPHEDEANPEDFRYIPCIECLLTEVKRHPFDRKDILERALADPSDDALVFEEREDAFIAGMHPGISYVLLGASHAFAEDSCAALELGPRKRTGDNLAKWKDKKTISLLEVTMEGTEELYAYLKKSRPALHAILDGICAHSTSVSCQ